MIAAYQSGIPGNGKPFPDGSRMAKIHRSPKRLETFTTATVPANLHDVDFVVKDGKRFANSGGWGSVAFKYKAGQREEPDVVRQLLVITARAAPRLAIPLPNPPSSTRPCLRGRSAVRSTGPVTIYEAGRSASELPGDRHRRQRQCRRDEAGQAPRGGRGRRERDGPNDPIRELSFWTYPDAA